MKERLTGFVKSSVLAAVMVGPGAAPAGLAPLERARGCTHRGPRHRDGRDALPRPRHRGGRQVKAPRIVRDFDPQTPREGADAITRNFILHAFPVRVTKRALAWWTTGWPRGRR